MMKMKRLMACVLAFCLLLGLPFAVGASQEDLTVTDITSVGDQVLQVKFNRPVYYDAAKAEYVMIGVVQSMSKLDQYQNSYQGTKMWNTTTAVSAVTDNSANTVTTGGKTYSDTWKCGFSANIADFINAVGPNGLFEGYPLTFAIREKLDNADTSQSVRCVYDVNGNELIGNMTTGNKLIRSEYHVLLAETNTEYVTLRSVTWYAGNASDVTTLRGWFSEWIGTGEVKFYLDVVNAAGEVVKDYILSPVTNNNEKVTDFTLPSGESRATVEAVVAENPGSKLMFHICAMAVKCEDGAVGGVWNGSRVGVYSRYDNDKYLKADGARSGRWGSLIRDIHYCEVEVGNVPTLLKATISGDDDSIVILDFSHTVSYMEGYSAYLTPQKGDGFDESLKWNVNLDRVSAGPANKLYGTIDGVTSQEILNRCKAAGYDVDDLRIVIAEPGKLDAKYVALDAKPSNTFVDSFWSVETGARLAGNALSDAKDMATASVTVDPYIEELNIRSVAKVGDRTLQVTFNRPVYYDKTQADNVGLTVVQSMNALDQVISSYQKTDDGKNRSLWMTTSNVTAVTDGTARTIIKDDKTYSNIWTCTFSADISDFEALVANGGLYEGYPLTFRIRELLDNNDSSQTVRCVYDANGNELVGNMKTGNKLIRSEYHVLFAKTTAEQVTLRSATWYLGDAANVMKLRGWFSEWVALGEVKFYLNVVNADGEIIKYYELSSASNNNEKVTDFTLPGKETRATVEAVLAENSGSKLMFHVCSMAVKSNDGAVGGVWNGSRVGVYSRLDNEKYLKADGTRSGRWGSLVRDVNYCEVEVGNVPMLVNAVASTNDDSVLVLNFSDSIRIMDGYSVFIAPQKGDSLDESLTWDVKLTPFSDLADDKFYGLISGNTYSNILAKCQAAGYDADDLRIVIAETGKLDNNANSVTVTSDTKPQNDFVDNFRSERTNARLAGNLYIGTKDAAVAPLILAAFDIPDEMSGKQVMVTGAEMISPKQVKINFSAPIAYATVDGQESMPYIAMRIYNADSKLLFWNPYTQEHVDVEPMTDADGKRIYKDLNGNYTTDKEGYNEKGELVAYAAQNNKACQFYPVKTEWANDDHTGIITTFASGDYLKVFNLTEMITRDPEEVYGKGAFYALCIEEDKPAMVPRSSYVENVVRADNPNVALTANFLPANRDSILIPITDMKVGYTASIITAKAQIINSTQIRVTFSESVNIPYQPFMALRYVGEGGELLYFGKKTDSPVMQWSGSWKWEDASHKSLIWTMTAQVIKGEGLYELANFVGSLEQFKGQGTWKFVIEEKNQTGFRASQRNRLVDNVMSLDGINQLASNYSFGLDGFMMDLNMSDLVGTDLQLLSAQALDDQTIKLTFNDSVQVTETASMGIRYLTPSGDSEVLTDGRAAYFKGTWEYADDTGKVLIWKLNSKYADNLTDIIQFNGDFMWNNTARVAFVIMDAVDPAKPASLRINSVTDGGSGFRRLKANYATDDYPMTQLDIEVMYDMPEADHANGNQQTEIVYVTNYLVYGIVSGLLALSGVAVCIVLLKKHRKNEQ